MPRPRPQSGRNPSSRSKKKGGSGWLVLFGLLAIILAAFVFAPDLLRKISDQAKPQDLGPEPTEAVDASATTQARTQPSMPARDIGIEEGALARRTDSSVQVTAASTGPKAGADDARATAVLDRAQTAYRGFAWDDARSLARQIRNMTVSTAIKVRADDMIHGADQLEEVFNRLNTKDELVRNIETHPLLVTITVRGRDENVLPVIDARDKVTPETNDPAAWIRSQLTMSGQVTVMTTSRIAYPVKQADVADIRPADLAMHLADKRADFDRR
nr:hypothetical protein [Planctomycetota bacterium]